MEWVGTAIGFGFGMVAWLVGSWRFDIPLRRCFYSFSCPHPFSAVASLRPILWVSDLVWAHVCIRLEGPSVWERGACGIGVGIWRTKMK